MVRTWKGSGKVLQRIYKFHVQVHFAIINGSSINHSLMIMSKIYETRKQAKLQWWHNLTQINADNLKNATHEARSYFREKKKEHLKGKNQCIETVSLGILDLYNGIHEMKYGYQTKTKLVKDTKGDLHANSHNIWKRSKKCSLVTKFAWS